MVHETENHHTMGWVGKREETYLWIDLVDHLNRFIHSAIMDRLSNSNTVPDAVHVGRVADVRFLSKLLGGAGVAFRDKVVHDDPVDVTDENVSRKARHPSVNVLPSNEDEFEDQRYK